MANWYSLAPEVHDIILSFFCQDIIDEYIPFDLVNIDLYPQLNLMLEPIWPSPSETLRNFSSALLTCRSFYHTLNCLRINGQSTTARLQFVQLRRCSVIVEYVD